MRNLKISTIQAPIIWENPTANHKAFGKKIKALTGQTDLILLPEMFTTGFSMKPNKIAEDSNGPTLKWMKRMAHSAKAAIAGSIIFEEKGKYYNRLIFMRPNGKFDTYDKRHLFSFGKEDKHYTAGTERLIVNWKAWKICPMICYDLRFPAWSRNNDAYDLLLYVANWPALRMYPWNILLRARAIENMAYVAGVNRIGVDGSKLSYSGESGVFGPLGQRLYQSSEVEQFVTTELSAENLQNARKKFNFLADQDSYQIEI